MCLFFPLTILLLRAGKPLRPNGSGLFTTIYLAKLSIGNQNRIVQARPFGA
jgi:hypothetical protein